MDTNKLIRLCGLAMIVGGLLYLPIPIREWIEAEAAEPYQSLLTIEYSLWRSRLVIQKYFLLFGFFGVFIYQLERAGRIGLIAIVLASVGNAALAGVTMMNHAMEPPLAALGHPLLGCMEGFRFQEVFADPSFSCASARLGARNFWTLSALGSATVGTALLGLSIARAKVLPPWAGLLIALGWTFSPFAALMPNVLVTVVIMAIVIGYAWCGWAMWKNPASRQPAPERQ